MFAGRAHAQPHGRRVDLPRRAEHAARCTRPRPRSNAHDAPHRSCEGGRCALRHSGGRPLLRDHPARVSARTSRTHPACATGGCALRRSLESPRNVLGVVPPQQRETGGTWWLKRPSRSDHVPSTRIRQRRCGCLHSADSAVPMSRELAHGLTIRYATSPPKLTMASIVNPRVAHAARRTCEIARAWRASSDSARW